jgi:hypothetical protein
VDILINTPEDAICPSCGGNMDRGWIASNKRIYWNINEPGVSGKSKNAERLSASGRFGMAPARLSAYRCRSCRLIRYFPPEFDWAH